MKHSLTKQLSIIFTFLMAAVVLVSWVCNNIFLENFLLSNKEQELIGLYSEMNEFLISYEKKVEELPEELTMVEIREINNLVDDFQHEMRKICSVGNISVLTLNLDSEIEKVLCNYSGDPIISQRLIDYILGRQEDQSVTFIKKTDRYVVQTSQDPVAELDYVEVIGNFDNGFTFIMRSAVQSIQESVQLSNRFFLFVGLITIVVAGICICYVSRKITKPIVKLKDISSRMSQLDFEVKYEGKEKNEIGQLGEHMNRLSEALEKTISELKTANVELEKDVQEKTQIDEMRKEFLSNVSHELKTPIALIQGYAEGLKEGINDDCESRDFYCEVIMDEASKMNKMVKKLLTLNQIEFSNEIVEMERFDLVSLIRGVIHSSNILLQQKGAEVIFECNGPIYVWGDEFKVEEVVTNYFSNAIHHVSGDMKIEVRIIPRGDRVRVTVFNTGSPIPEEDIENIWIKFYKVDKARTREYGGSGIGLSIVKAIMDSFQQECGVQNYENGVEFWFELDRQ